MNNALTFTFLLIGIPMVLSAQISDNMSLLGQWDDNTLPLRSGLAYNEIWGYADPDNGKEYAIIGTVQKVFFLDITDPANPTIKDEITGGSSTIWRDMKNFGSYLYCVADEGNEGLIVVDISDLDTSATVLTQSNSDFARAHNVFVDNTTSTLFVAGSNTTSSGLKVYDLGSTPNNPTLTASPTLPGGYVHDLYARNDTVYCNHGNNGLYIYDFSDPANPIQLASLTTYAESGYNHSCWLTDHGDYLVFCDETHGRGVKMMDVSDFTNLDIIDIFRSELLAPVHTNSIAHNPIIIGDTVYLSYYHDGIQVFEFSDPSDVQRIAYYDTYTAHSNYAGYDGAWGVYPLLPSGNIIGSDVLNGLYILAISNGLPVEWLDFFGKAERNHIELYWATASETNSESFILQRSNDGRLFEDINQLPAAGNSLSIQSYNYQDLQPNNGWNYYRIKQVDYDGKFAFSKTIAIAYGEDEFKIYPNQIIKGYPIQLHLPIQEENVSIQLFNSAGQVVFSDFIQADQPELEWLTPNLPSGIYILQLTYNNGLQYNERLLLR